MRPIVARDLMTPDVLGVPETWTVQETAQYLVDHEISGAVVRAEDGRTTGVVSLTDIAAAAADQSSRIGVDRRWPGFYASDWDERLDTTDLARMRFDPDEPTVGDVMTPDLFTVDVDTEAPAIAREMLESHIHRVLVEEKGEIVGVITTSDPLGLLVQD